MIRVAWRSMMDNRVRFLLPAIAIVFGVAFVTGSLVYGETVRAAVEGAPKDFDVQVEQRDNKALSAATIERLRGVAGAGGLRPVAEGPAFLVGKDGKLVGTPGSDGGVNFDPQRHELTNGVAPSGPDEAALDKWAAQRTGYQVGDKMRVVVAGTARDVRLTGVFDYENTRIVRGGTLVAFADATAREQFGHGGYTSALLTAAPGTGPGALATAVETASPDLRTSTADELTSLEASDNDKLTMILLIFAGVALFSSAFLVANTFTMLAAARAREHALLRAIGAGRRYVLRMVLTEASLLGVAATAVGYLLGVGGAAVLKSEFAVFEGAPVPLRPFTPATLLAAFGVGLGVTLLAAYLPARRAAAVPPVAALRTGLPPTGKSLRRRNIVGFVVTAIGTLMVVLGRGEQTMIYLGAPTMLIGLIILTPLLAAGLTSVLRGPLTRFAGLTGTLAVENTRRNPRRTGATASALMIGLSVCAAVTVPIASISAKSEETAKSWNHADIRVEALPFADVSPSTADEIAKVPGVEHVTALRQALLPLDKGSLQVTGVNAGSISALVPLTIREGSLDQLGTGIAVHSGVAAAHGWTVGSKVGEEKPLTVVATFDAPEEFGADALVDTANIPADELWNREILIKAGGSAEKVRDDIRSALDNPVLVVQTRDEYVESQAAQYDLYLNLLYAMLSVSVLIGAMSVVNTMTMSTMERIREIGLLRAVGLGRSQVGAVLRIESVIIAVIGALAGVVSGCVIGAMTVSGQANTTPVLPWDRLAVFMAITVAIGVAAAFVPARRAVRIPILTAIKTDTE
ncbi:FtsX-like permease family protein [Lentzea sp. BCCO 10_0061]|uniref:FtsX-like permease family protein n=1 Tax=Lentzea sokolovensis TaxID=3095429 RepID=A0ABU4V786_9PSEU|nr:FtsX-like permease family protein [Lentzea sp. BCCO 10_0061]MDX8147227.1 FtsX-like permease family protein [Lentzea sp. BCCO 10_0061]